MQYSTMQLSAVQYGDVQGSAVLCSAVQCSTLQCRAVQCTAVMFKAVLCSTVLCSTVLPLLRPRVLLLQAAVATEYAVNEVGQDYKAHLRCVEAYSTPPLPSLPF